MSDVEAYFAKYGQSHVFQYKDSLSEAELVNLLAQASAINLKEVLTLDRARISLAMDWMAPPKFIPLPEYGGDNQARKEAKHIGEQAIRSGKVAVVTVAGGQGTRLGFAGPKGAFPATSIKKKSLFQVFAEKIRVAQDRYQVKIPWFIMTSEQNHEATISFFDEHKNFELSEVYFFQQGLIPVLDHNGKLLMEAKGSIAVSPNGHGGVFSALANSGSFDRMKEQGIEVLSYFQVDNPMVHCIDPVFIGFHLMQESEMSSKMVRKIAADEKVGVFGDIDGKLQLIEYSDMPKELNEAKDEHGDLIYIAGNPAIHLMNRQFAERVARDKDFKLPYHRADKCVLALDDLGNSVKPKTPNAIKWEMFIFDALPMAKNAIVLEAAREVEFSPIKNAEGFASQQTCLEDQNLLFAHWLDQVGVAVPRDEEGVPSISIEISPLFADTLESFIGSWNALENKPEIGDDVYIEKTTSTSV